MDVDFYEREGSIPSKLLKDGDDTLSENRNGLISTEFMSNGFGSSGSSFSGLSSPFGSELSSTETETESDDGGDGDDDFISKLTRQMADYMLEEDDRENVARNCISENLKNSYGLPDSPQYTLSGSDDQTRAVHFYRLENQPSPKDQGYEYWGRPVKRAELTQQIEQKQQLKKAQHNMQSRGGRASDGVSGGGFRLSATEWPALQKRRQQPKQQDGSGSAMRAVFLGGPGSRSASFGTGVFLPRGTDNTTLDVRKKPGCSTVLIPARVMQALQQHFQEMKARSQSSSCLDVGVSQGSNYSQQERPSESRTSQAMNQHEMGLPQEWTY